MRWLSSKSDKGPSEPSEPAAGPAHEAPPGPGAVDRWAEDEPDAAGSEDRPAGGDERFRVPPDLGTIDPTELGRATRRAVARALAEDLGDRGDITSLATVPAGRTGRGVVVAREAGTVFGVEVVLHVFEQVDTRVEVQIHIEDGARVEAGQTIATLVGPLSSILTGERVALNFLGHLSGIATTVRRFVDAAGPGVAIRDTRKTTPGLRLLEKVAVKAGGGHNHRIGLYDALLVKDNHIVAAGSVTAAVEAGFSRGHGRPLQVEVTSLTELHEAIEAGARDILLDNFTPDGIRQAVQRTAGRASLEASGNIDVGSVAEYAATGVDRIAIGRLTHSTAWLDVALDLTSDVGAETGTDDHASGLWHVDEQPDAPQRPLDHDDADVPDTDTAAATAAAEEPSAADGLVPDAEAPGAPGDDAVADHDRLPEAPPLADVESPEAGADADADGEPHAGREPTNAELTAALEEAAAEAEGAEASLLPDPDAPDLADQPDADVPHGEGDPTLEQAAGDAADGDAADGAADGDEEDDAPEPLAGDSLFAWRDQVVRAPDGGPA